MNLKNLSVRTKIPKLLLDKLKNKKILQIYKKFEKTINIEEEFIVSVSGGPDSLALAFLSKIYSLKHEINVKFLIVDHKLRKESSNEAKKVKKLLKKYFINLEILNWNGKKPINNVQSRARNKRYELLFRKCHKLKIMNVLVGHHQDDLFENFFIRMIRGSGLKGLVSLNIKNKIGKFNVLRPLLNHKKSELIFLAKYVFGFYVQDPTNIDDKYQRTKVRKLIKQLKIFGLDEKKFEKTIENLKLSNDVINFYVSKNLKQNAFFVSKKNRMILNNEFFEQPYEIVFRAFSDIVKIIGGKYYPPRGKKLDKIIDEIKNGKLSKATLGGCMIEKVNLTVIISREY